MVCVSDLVIEHIRIRKATGQFFFKEIRQNEEVRKRSAAEEASAFAKRNGKKKNSDWNADVDTNTEK
jgi:hypothetical protein